MVRFRPRGYVGIEHRTIGSAVLALYHALLLPEEILGTELATRIREMNPNGWYPIADMLDPLEQLAESVGVAGLRKVGRKLFELSHEQRARGVMKSARDIAYGLDLMYREANRGRDIGGWKVLSFESGECQLEKSTPHHCGLDEGLIRAVMAMIDIPVNIEQSRCLRAGDDHCRFVITSVVIGEPWMGAAANDLRA